MIPIYRIHNHSGCCNGVNRVNEHDIEELTKEALRKTVDSQDEICEALENTLITCLQISQSSEESGVLKRLREQKTVKEKKIDKLIAAIADDGFTGLAKERIKKDINKISEEIESLENEIREREGNRIDDTYIAEKVRQIRQSIQELREFRTINREQVLNYVDKILVHADGSIDIILQSGTRMAIKRKEQIKSISPEMDSVGKTVRQDTLSKHLSNKEKPILAAFFTYTILVRGRKEASEIAVRCYLKS